MDVYVLATLRGIVFTRYLLCGLLGWGNARLADVEIGEQFELDKTVAERALNVFCRSLRKFLLGTLKAYV